jgi:uncharacterized protein (TIGR03083 family)
LAAGQTRLSHVGAVAAAAAAGPAAAAELPVSILSSGRRYAEITRSTGILAQVIDEADLTRPVPTCPDWTLRQLATHVGRAHRWAAEIVSTRSAEFIPFRSVPDGRFPDDPAQHAVWLRAGAARLNEAVQQAGDDQVWGFGVPRPASFWARRMAHETAVHRADAQLATGQAPVIDTDVAADGIDEWFTFVTIPDPGEPDTRLDGLAEGQSLHVHAADGAGEWLIRRDTAGVEVRREHGKADAAVRGPASDLLLVLTRRLLPGHPGIEVLGNPAVLSNWLAATKF